MQSHSLKRRSFVIPKGTFVSFIADVRIPSKLESGFTKKDYKFETFVIKSNLSQDEEEDFTIYAIQHKWDAETAQVTIDKAKDFNFGFLRKNTRGGTGIVFAQACRVIDILV